MAPNVLQNAFGEILHRGEHTAVDEVAFDLRKATWVPARRSVNVNPLEPLRHD